eukprot:CAMPEP_0179422942 /NCGR_PEP_ID=MMETSP0799-20121207/10726_1 /TAXON_ID=46947 /ORGANISM="Geminigera cryophila, Strain CCMP2564" /LENGTH=49 /DNA_ID=CAMNT_0021197165 /DNA_START=739 /DNA_END=888 /DNA_ORIENTATION=+
MNGLGRREVCDDVPQGVVGGLHPATRMLLERLFVAARAGRAPCALGGSH